MPLDPLRAPLQSPAAPAAKPAAARQAAQRAFFDLAAGKASAPAETAAKPPPPSAVQPHVKLPAEPPAKILRPGSLLNIRV